MSGNGNGSLQSVVDKIHKLMQLTPERGASEAEAALAAGHVQRLLAEHNLSMATVEASGGNSGEAGKRERGEIKRRQVYRWQRTLMESIATLNYCHLTLRWIEKSNTSRTFNGYELIGRAANVATASHTFEYLIEVIERLARADVGRDPTQFFTKYAHSFKEGCSDRLCESLRDKYHALAREARERAEAAKKASANHSAGELITLDDVERNETDLNNDFRHGWAPGTTALNRAKADAESTYRTAERRSKKEALIAEGVPADVAEWMSWGYSRERADEMVKPEPIKTETDAQRRKREERERRDSDRFWRSYEAKQEREARRLDQTGYRRGQEAGKTVGLDPQVKRDSDRNKLR